MKVILNIGLAVGTNGNIGPGTVLREIQGFGFDIVTYGIVHSDTERTIVALVDDRDAAGQDNRIYQLSRFLQQDCIAVYYPETRDGALIGPKADEWGEFNPEFFFLFDGTRLAQPAKAAA